MTIRYDFDAQYPGDTMKAKEFEFTTLDLTLYTPVVRVTLDGVEYLNATEGSGLQKTANSVILEQFDLPTEAEIVGSRFLGYDFALTDQTGAKTTHYYGRIPILEDFAP